MRSRSLRLKLVYDVYHSWVIVFSKFLENFRSDLDLKVEITKIQTQFLVDASMYGINLKIMRCSILELAY